MASRAATRTEEEVSLEEASLEEDTIRGGTVSTNIEIDLFRETRPNTEDSQLTEARRETGHGLSLVAGASPKAEDNSGAEAGGAEDIAAGAATEAGTHLLAAFIRSGDHEEAELPGAPGVKPQATSNASGV